MQRKQLSSNYMISHIIGESYMIADQRSESDIKNSISFLKHLPYDILREYYDALEVTNVAYLWEAQFGKMLKRAIGSLKEFE